jgi:hypothetical protein
MGLVASGTLKSLKYPTLPRIKRQLMDRINMKELESYGVVWYFRRPDQKGIA